MIAPSSAGGSQDQSRISVRISSGSVEKGRREGEEREERKDGTAYPCDTQMLRVIIPILPC